MSRSDVIDPQQLPPVPSLKPKDIKLREAAHNEWFIVAEAGTTLERLSESSYYATVAGQFIPYDELIIVDAGRTFYARYVVLQCGNGYAEVQQLSYVKLPAMLCSIGEKLPSNHRLVYCGPDEMWSAVRNSDGLTVIKNAISQEDCLSQLLNHASLRT
ncbi:hypothetical protein NVV94_05670 [Pseudomonas sp. LS1212]|uniref:hypothetical protein n=1 Tax=Pseudomonas sp. LS1212 TaxID=2972478 RepID=UPI00215D0B46|nr:hypothetical protein [Pseudomonas sp. LS1212]UVJ45070.1 hypothetical protein NVV94_05670 [Pseudomonas sp. LS1212]